MSDREEADIPPTENLQRIERRELCRCGDSITLPADANTREIVAAVTRHQRTLKHRSWWDHIDLTGEDW